MRIRFAVTALAVGLMVGGCFSDSTSSGNGDIGPTDPTTGNGSGSIPPGGATPPFAPLFRPAASGILPFPIDLYFSGSTDGTLNIPASIQSFVPHYAAVNALDGFSTMGDIRVRFSSAIDAATLAANVRVVRVSVDNKTKATTGVLGIPQPNVDYSISVSPDFDTGGATMLIRPLKPLVASSGATNNGYLILVTNGVKSTNGTAAAPDAEYLTVRTGAIADIAAGLTTPTCASVTNATLNGICKLTFAHLRIGGALGIAPTSVTLSFSFSTESTRDTLAFIAAPAGTPNDPVAAAPGPYTVDATKVGTTASLGLPAPGIADLYNGTLTVPYYLTKPTAANDCTSPLTKPWQAMGPGVGIDPNSRHLSRFNPIPGKTADVTIPMLVALPNAGSGRSKPAGGWPIVVFQHGFPRDRTDAILIADRMAASGLAVIAIDLPLHGVTEWSAAYAQPFKQTAIERTFNLDCQVNGRLGVPGADGKVDTTGVNFLNLANVLVQRDNSRQAIADLIQLIRTIPAMDVDGGGADFDASRIHIIGYSLGGTHTATVLGLLGSEVKASALPSSASILSRTIVESPTYGGLINALLTPQGVVPGTTLYREFFTNLQAAYDSADPINYIANATGPASGNRSLLLSVFAGGAGSPVFPPDPVVPVSSTQALINGAGATLRVSAVGTTNVAGTNGAWVSFSQGIHNSLLDPGPAPLATQELQGEIAHFLETNGAEVRILESSVITP